jgi:transposase
MHTTIGLDLAKNVFQVHGVGAVGKVVYQRQLRRGQVIAFFKKLPHCLVGMEIVRDRSPSARACRW